MKYRIALLVGLLFSCLTAASHAAQQQEGNSTTMEVANVKINTRLAAADFSFMIPPGVQLVRTQSAPLREALQC